MLEWWQKHKVRFGPPPPETKIPRYAAGFLIKNVFSTRRKSIANEPYVELFDVFPDVVGDRLAERHALVRVVEDVAEAPLQDLLDDSLSLLHRKQRLRLHTVRVFVLNL